MHLPFPTSCPLYGGQGHLGPLRSPILIDGPPTGGTSCGTLALTGSSYKEPPDNRFGGHELG
jgi:hypothetical protein